MRIECDEWAAEDAIGDREYMGRHLYTADDCAGVIQRGGAIEYDGIFAITKTMLDSALYLA